MKATLKKLVAALLALSLAAAGCYMRDHEARIVHIFGIGWFRQSTRTNDVRAFAIGTLDAGHYTINVNTGAPISFGNKQQTNNETTPGKSTP